MTEELSWNIMRELQMKREMDTMMKDTTQSRINEKSAKACKEELAARPTKHKKFSWEEFISQQ